MSAASSVRQHDPARPEPLCKPVSNPLAYTAIGGYLGILIVAALYYLLFETTTTMNNWWHSTVPNSDVRHSIRNVGEGLLGGLLGIQLAWNHYKPKVQRKLGKPPTLLDRIEMTLRIPNLRDKHPFTVGELLRTPPLVVLYAIPGFVVGFLIVDFLHHHTLHVATPFSTNPTTATFAEKFKATWTDDWPKKLIGYFAAFFFGRRPAKAVFDDVQYAVAERHVAHGKPTRWWHPAPFRARCTDIQQRFAPDLDRRQATPWARRGLIAAIVIGFALACYGEYILLVVAHR